MSRRPHNRVRYQSHPARPHRRLGDRLPGVAGISMSAAGGYFLAKFFADYMNNTYGKGYVNPVPAARENTLTDPGYEVGTATVTFALLTLSVVTPPLYDWLMADGSRLRRFITAISHCFSSCGRSTGSSLDEDEGLVGYAPLDQDASSDAVASWHHTATGKLTWLAYLSNVLHVTLRVGSAVSFAGADFSTIAVQPMANQFIPFKLSADDDQNAEIVAHAETRAAQIGFPVIVVAQFLAALPAWATILTYTEEPAIYPKQGTFFDKVCYFNAIFSDLFVIHQARQNTPALPAFRQNHYDQSHFQSNEDAPTGSRITESEMQLIGADIVRKRQAEEQRFSNPLGEQPHFISPLFNDQQPLLMASFGGAPRQEGATSVSGLEQRSVVASASQTLHHPINKTGSLKGQFTLKQPLGKGTHSLPTTQQTSTSSVRRQSAGADLPQLADHHSSDDEMMQESFTRNPARLRSATSGGHSGSSQGFLAPPPATTPPSGLLAATVAEHVETTPSTPAMGFTLTGDDSTA